VRQRLGTVDRVHGVGGRAQGDPPRGGSHLIRGHGCAWVDQPTCKPREKAVAHLDGKCPRKAWRLRGAATRQLQLELMCAAPNQGEGEDEGWEQDHATMVPWGEHVELTNHAPCTSPRAMGSDLVRVRLQMHACASAASSRSCRSSKVEGRSHPRIDAACLSIRIPPWEIALSPQFLHVTMSYECCSVGARMQP
jgi:hypothetical protein